MTNNDSERGEELARLKINGLFRFCGGGDGVEHFHVLEGIFGRAGKEVVGPDAPIEIVHASGVLIGGSEGFDGGLFALGQG